MPLFTRRSPMPVSADELYAWHARPGAFERLNPPWEPARVVARDGPFETLRATVRVPALGPLGLTWVARHFDAEPGRQFRDRQEKGPFAEWVHIHRMIPDRPAASVLEDEIAYRLPLGAVGQLAGGRTVRKRLEAVFAYRHRVTASDLRRHAAVRDRPRLTVAVTGSRGLIGSELVPFLTAGGHRVVRLVTGSAARPFDDGTTWVPWDPMKPLDPGTFADVDAVVHLAAEPIAAGRWTRAKRRAIHDSRTVPTRHLAEAAAKAGVKAFVSASAVGVYGDRRDEELAEDAAPGPGFIADVCRAWEAATEPAAAAGVRVVTLRIGVVLTPKGAALGRQLAAFRGGLGAVLGSGRQWVPWIGMGDTVGAIHHALMADGLRGPVNVVAPGVVRQRAFATSLGRVLRRPVFMHLPGWALRRLFGPVADPALLASMRVVPRKLLATGFAFDRPELEPELRHLLGRTKPTGPAGE